MKYWEVVADKLHASGWSWGYCSAVTEDAHIRRIVIFLHSVLASVAQGGQRQETDGKRSELFVLLVDLHNSTSTSKHV